MRAISAVLVATAVLACESAAGPQALIHKQDGGELVVRIEVADDREEQMRGLMYRTELAADAGMLFLFDQEQPRAFWMKNTPLPLDIIYIAKDGRIVSIAEHTTPFSTAAIPSGVPAQNVLEVNAGYAQRNGVRVGDRVVPRGIP
jgi:uncharacterized protein